VTDEATVVIGVVNQRNLHRVAAAFKPEIESFVGHGWAKLIAQDSFSVRPRTQGRLPKGQVANYVVPGNPSY
jgi:hypothetical protein